MNTLNRYLLTSSVLFASVALMFGCGSDDDDNTFLPITPVPAIKGELAYCPPPEANSGNTPLPTGTTCWTGKDKNGAYFWVAKPRSWNGKLVIHAHGGPQLGTPTIDRVPGDLNRWTVWVRSGYAFAATSYKIAGVAVMSAAEDMAELLPIAVATLGETPSRVILHGQSWGAGVAARAAEVNGPLSKVSPKIDAVLLTSGVLGGGTNSYDFRMDIRVIYQALCGNHPSPDEEQYPLWWGLPQEVTTLTPSVRSRLNQCLELDNASGRSATAQEKIDLITKILQIPETAIYSHVNWATAHFQDIVFNRLNGGNPFATEGITYNFSDATAAQQTALDELNQKVLRYTADPVAVKAFAADSDPTGNIAVPMLTLRYIGDTTAFVELAHTWEDTVQKAGRSDNLVQVYSNNSDHSYLEDEEYVALMGSMMDWLDNGVKPTPQSVSDRCERLPAPWKPTTTTCQIDANYTPSPLSTRVFERVK